MNKETELIEFIKVVFGKTDIGLIHSATHAVMSVRLVKSIDITMFELASCDKIEDVGKLLRPLVEQVEQMPCIKTQLDNLRETNKILLKKNDELQTEVTKYRKFVSVTKELK